VRRSSLRATVGLERWSPKTESGLQACYGKSPGNGAFSMAADSPATRQAHPAADSTAVSVEPLGAVTRRCLLGLCRQRAAPRAKANRCVGLDATIQLARQVRRPSKGKAFATARDEGATVHSRSVEGLPTAPRAVHPSPRTPRTSGPAPGTASHQTRNARLPDRSWRAPPPSSEDRASRRPARSWSPEHATASFSPIVDCGAGSTKRRAHPDVP